MRGGRQKYEVDKDLVQAFAGNGPCTYLLLALIGTILVYPYAHGNAIGRVILAAFYSLVLVGGAFAVGQNRRMLIAELGLAVLAIALLWGSILTANEVLDRLAVVIFIFFLLLTIGEVLRYILKRGPVTADKLHGALASYIMIIFLFAFIYSVVESFTPGSFNFPQADATDPHAVFRLLYFSFTTLTTVGYGDIVPVTDQARSFVIIEEFTGVFFVAILIARLAGLYPQASK